MRLVTLILILIAPTWAVASVNIFDYKKFEFIEETGVDGQEHLSRLSFKITGPYINSSKYLDRDTIKFSLRTNITNRNGYVEIIFDEGWLKPRIYSVTSKSEAYFGKSSISSSGKIDLKYITDDEKALLTWIIVNVREIIEFALSDRTFSSSDKALNWQKISESNFIEKKLRTNFGAVSGFDNLIKAADRRNIQKPEDLQYIVKPLLSKLGYFNGPFDTKLTAQTIKGIKAFEYDYGLLPDGKLVSNSELNLLSDAATAAGVLNNSEKEAPEDGKLNLLQEQLFEVTRERDGLIARLNETLFDLTKSKNDLISYNSLQKDNKALKIEIDSLKKEIASLRKASKSENDKASITKEALLQEFEKIYTELDTLRAILNANLKMSQQSTDDIAALGELSKIANSTSLERQKLLSENASLKEELSSMLKQKADYDYLKKQLEAEKQTVKDLKESIEEVEAIDIETTEQLVSSLQMDLKDSQDKVELLKGYKLALEEELEDLKEYSQILMADIKEWEDQLYPIMLAEHDKQEKQIDKLNETIKNLKKENSQLSKDLAYEMNIYDLSSDPWGEIESSRQEIKNLKAEIAALKSGKNNRSKKTSKDNKQSAESQTASFNDQIIPKLGDSAIVYFGNQKMTILDAIVEGPDLVFHPTNKNEDSVIYAYSSSSVTRDYERLDFAIYDRNSKISNFVALDTSNIMIGVMNGRKGRISKEIMKSSEKALRKAANGKHLLKFTGRFNIFTNTVDDVYFSAKKIEIVK